MSAPTADEQRAHIARLRAVHTRRLHKLREQAAEFGAHTPAEVAIEIDQIQVDLKALDMMEHPPISAEVAEVLDAGGTNPYQINLFHQIETDAHLNKLDRAVAAVDKAMGAFDVKLDRVLQFRWPLFAFMGINFLVALTALILAIVIATKVF